MVSAQHTYYNSLALERELAWFKNIVKARFKNWDKWNWSEQIKEIAPPTRPEYASALWELIESQEWGVEERLIFMVAAAPHLRPEILDSFRVKHSQFGYMRSEFGGWQGKHHRGFLPTGETVSCLLAGGLIADRIKVQELLGAEAPLAKNQILWLEALGEMEPFLSGPLSLNPDILDQITVGKIRDPKFSNQFPAQRLTTSLDWTDLVVHPSTQQTLIEIESWVKHHTKLMDTWGLGKRVKGGYNALFYGPPGTGKSLTAALIGKRANREVYRIDLAKLVSKYIGETEKNLSRVFDKAQNKDWILFFDEADALFGKRTNVNNSNDRYANQEVSYLLQRIEDYQGLAVLATNLKSNIDNAFLRRFQSIIHFPMPGPVERARLWTESFSDQSKLDVDIDIAQISKTYELAGGSINNAVSYSSLKAIERGSNVIQLTDLIDGIKREFAKEGRSV